MWPAFLSPADRRGYLEPVSPRRRAASIALTIAVHVLIVWLLFRLAPQPRPREPERAPSTFSMLPDDSQAAPKAAAKAKATAKAAKASVASARPLPPPLPLPRPDTPAPPTEKPPTILWDKSLYAAADVGKIKGTANEADDSGAGTDSGTAYGPGAGPGGQRLYNVEWYRRPVWSEIAPYLPADPPAHGQAILACRMVEHYHVENCQVLGETPRGSGLGKAIRLAAWQFLIRPPRLGGKVLTGQWVRITYDLSITRGE